jgi:FKBP-type peptidyl-prolyl cis-trans isomerase SlyD
MKIAKEKVVSIHYTLRNEDGEIIDSSDGQEPLVYIHGTGNLIPGLESSLEGKSPGEKMKVTVPPETAYGEFDEAKVFVMSKKQFDGINDLEVGMQFNLQGSGDGDLLVTVTSIGEDSVTVDGNHPLAGMTLAFDVDIVEVRNATKEELQHGHVHGAGGHQH